MHRLNQSESNLLMLGVRFIIFRKNRSKIKRPLLSWWHRMIGLERICNFYSGICRLIFRANLKIGCRKLSIDWCRNIRRDSGRKRRSRRIWISEKELWHRSKWVKKWRIRLNMTPWMLWSGMSSSRRNKAFDLFTGQWRISLETWW